MARAPRLPWRAERRRTDGRRARPAIITTTHRLRTRHHSVSPRPPRYCRNRFSPYPHNTRDSQHPAGRTPTAPTRPHLSTTYVLCHDRATRINHIGAIIGRPATTSTKWRIERERVAAKRRRASRRLRGVKGVDAGSSGRAARRNHQRATAKQSSIHAYLPR